MTDELRVLILAPDPEDAEKMVRALKAADFAPRARLVTSRDDYLLALESFHPGLIVSDPATPGLDSLTALQLARKLAAPTPFLVVSGGGNQQLLIDCMKAGADDFVLKEHLVRLPAAVTAALETHRARSAKRWAEEAYRSLAEGALQGLMIFQDNRIAYVNPAFCEILGYEPEQLRGLEFATFQNLVHADDRELVWGRYRERMAGKPAPNHYEMRVIRQDGRLRWLDMLASNVLLDRRPAIQAAVIDITERKRAELELVRGDAMFRAIFDQAQHLAGVVDLDGVLRRANPMAVAMIGGDESLCIDLPFWETPWWTHSPAVQEQLRDGIRRAAAGEFVQFETTHYGADGSLHYVDFTLKPVRDEAGRVFCLIPEGRDITPRKLAEEALRACEARFQALFAVMNEGAALHRVEVDEDGRPIDTVIVDVNPAYEKVLGIPRERAVGRRGAEVYGTDAPPLLEEYGALAQTGQTRRLVTHFAPLGKTFQISVCCPGPGTFAAVFEDITNRRAPEPA